MSDSDDKVAISLRLVEACGGDWTQAAVLSALAEAAEAAGGWSQIISDGWWHGRLRLDAAQVSATLLQLQARGWMRVAYPSYKPYCVVTILPDAVADALNRPPKGSGQIVGKSSVLSGEQAGNKAGRNGKGEDDQTGQQAGGKASGGPIVSRETSPSEGSGEAGRPVPGTPDLGYIYNNLSTQVPSLSPGPSVPGTKYPVVDSGCLFPDTDVQVDNGGPTPTLPNVSRETSGHVKASMATQVSAAFASFWRAYPRKEAKRDAWKAWQQERLEPLAESVVADVRRRSVSPAWLREAGRYIPLPATYLRGRRWEDEGTQLPQAAAHTMKDELTATLAEVEDLF